MLFGKKHYDFVAIGDLVVDDFIRLKDAETHCDIDQANCKLCVRFGDKVPFEFHKVLYAVGNSPNASVSASRLGLSSALIANIGDDENGKLCLESLKHDHVATDFVSTDKKLPTNYHYVLWYDVERTILVNHSPFEKHMPSNLAGPKWLYLSSLGSNTEAFHHEIAEWLKKNPNTKMAFQPGTFQISLGKEKLADIYSQSEVFFCNIEEAQKILGTEEKDKKILMGMMHDLGPKIVVLTDGINGAYARDTDGACYFMPIYPHTPVERTGAGDAYASTIVSCLAMGKSLKEALAWAPINSMSVVSYIGAQEGLLTQAKLLEYLKNAPADYKLKEI